MDLSKKIVTSPLRFTSLSELKAYLNSRPIQYMNGTAFPFLLSLFSTKDKAILLQHLTTKAEWERLYIDLLSSDLGREFEFTINRGKDKAKLGFFEGLKDEDFYEAAIAIKDVEKISSFLEGYISNFKNNNMISEVNAYSYEKHIKMLPDMFQEKYEDFGGKINIDINDFPDEYLHLPELLYSLHVDGFVRIEYVGYPFWSGGEGLTYVFEVSFLKSPDEIADNHKYWTNYGDIRVNQTNGIAKYKNNTYFYKSTTGKAFRLLCLLVKKHGVELDMHEVYSEIGDTPETGKEGNIDRKYVKSRLKDYIQEIKENLGIKKDKEASLDIIFAGDKITLISNPPKKPSKSN